MLEAADDEEKPKWMERSKRESLNVCMRLINEAKTRIFSHNVMCKESKEDDTEETQYKLTKCIHESLVRVLVRMHIL